jgi:hypothetical protein
VSATRLLEQQFDILGQDPLAVAAELTMMAVEIMIPRQLLRGAGLLLNYDPRGYSIASIGVLG